MLDMDDLAEETQARLANQGTQGAELFGGLSESIFAAVAANMVELGWSIFPQETGGERRLPGKLHGRTIKWREDYDLANNLPDAKFLRDCILQCASLNVACVFGPASGNTFAVDIDVLDEDMVDVIIGLAEEILGSTPFMRVGRAPKVALIYRHAAGEENLVPSTSRHFANVDADGTVTRSGDGLEILGSTRLITFHGRHHKTGGYFKWIGSATPLLDGPEKAPLVSADQVQTFLEAVDARYRFHRGASFRASGVSIKWDEHAWKSVPKISLAAGGTPWVEDNEGLITDGREAFLTSLVFHMISALKGELDAALESQDNRVIKAFQDRALAGILASFQSGARMDGRGRWSERELPREAWGKVTRLIGKYASGNIKLFNVAANERRSQPFLTMPDPVVKTATSQAHVDAESNADLEQAKDNRVVGDVGDNPDREQEEQSDEIVQADPELSFLRANSKRSHTGDNALRGTIEPLPDGEDNLEIPQDRGPIADMVQRGLDAAFLDFFLDVYGDPLGFGPDRKARVHVLKAPTGAGKTTRCIRMLAADPRTYSEHTWRDPSNGHVVKGAMPWVMLLPTYANIDELRLRAKVLNLDGSMDDNGLRVAAEQAGLIGEDELDSRLAELRQDALNCGLRTMVYSGKLRAGCKMSEKVEMAMAAGIGTSAFCKATVRHKADNASRNDPGTMVEELCAYYDTCPAIAQRASIADMHLVFAPHSFLALSIPPELEMVRGVIADERVHHLFLHTATFAATTLGIQRKPPRLSARERQQGLVPDDLLAERDMAAHIALQAMRGLGDDTTRCPASALDNYRVEGMDPHEMSPGLSLVRSALRVCSSAIQRDGNLSPLTPIQEVREMCARPTGRELREEWQFWRIVEERIMQMRSDALLVETIQASQKEFSDFAAQWTTEQRLRHERSLSTMQTRKLNAHGARDYRIQFLTDPAINGGAQEIVRISWRTQPNWPGIPLLLLDASAAPAIVAKIWGLKETDIVVHDVVKDTGRALNVKIVGVVNQTFSNSSIAASAAATEWERQQAARNLAKVRQVISTVSAVYGHGRVVLGAPIVLRELVNRGWACPDSVDPCHFGALRGLDGFKFHSAALSIGRMEPPTRTIDGLVAALTYDDPEPEEPFDRRGDGMSPVTDAPLRLPMGDQRIRLRSGYMATLKVPMFKGRWARLIQRQYREEELLQFVGRLRPVFRTGRTPVWFALSSVIPEELVVDDLITIDDLVQNHGRLWEAVRRTNGVAHPQALANACPDLFRSASSARAAMKSVGFPLKPDVPGHRASQGFSTWLWKDKKGKQQQAFVRASAPNPIERLQAALGDLMGAEQPVMGWSPDPGMGSRARPRLPDKVEERIGPVARRCVHETAYRDIVGERLLSAPGKMVSVITDNAEQAYPYGKDSVELSVQQATALVAIEGFWADRSGSADDRLMPMVAQGNPVEGMDEVAAYDQMAATFTDGDVPGQAG